MMQKRFSISLIAGIALVAVACGVGAPLSTDAPIASPGPSAAAGSIDWPVTRPEIDEPIASGEPDLVSISGGRPPTEAEVLALLKGDKAEFPRLTAGSVKTTTLGTLGNLLQGLPGGYASDRKIIVAIGVGTFLPELGRDGRTAGWGAIMVDAETGGVVGSFSSPGGVPAALRP